MFKEKSLSILIWIFNGEAGPYLGQMHVKKLRSTFYLTLTLHERPTGRFRLRLFEVASRGTLNSAPFGGGPAHMALFLGDATDEMDRQPLTMAMRSGALGGFAPIDALAPCPPPPTNAPVANPRVLLYKPLFPQPLRSSLAAANGLWSEDHARLDTR